MTRELADKLRARVRKVGFPWPSLLAGLVVMVYLWLTGEPELLAELGVSASWHPAEARYVLLGGFALLVLIDLRRHQRQRARQQADLLALQQQVDDLWEDRKRLQLKARTYSGQADKLKLFISDKLLEYIEYDEKFLHFKGIAAEVRHNGVISFDKVQTALQQAAVFAESVPGDTSSSAAPAPGDYQAALDAMRYLWDLLDLSTADNLALHIANHLCECEEHYYQRMLNVADPKPLPYEPAFSPQRATWRALEQIRQESLPPPEAGRTYTLDDNQWHVHLASTGELLGNENHLVLMLENLLKNAQFFSRKRGYAAPFASVALILDESQGQVRVRVYNRGPPVREEDRNHLFQLGYSTRRTRQHHGRGLGLYFVDQIVRGYEGHIAVHNIRTPETCYTVRIELLSGEVVTAQIEVIDYDGKAHCRAADGLPARRREWALDSRVGSVEVTSAGDETTQRIDEFRTKGKQDCFDPGHPERPHWRLHYQPRGRACRLGFEPLDFDGVEFEVRLPTASHRLEGGEGRHEEEEDSG